ncbi:MAG TPA: 4'-phosphopantetheinyl transferase superfamily protein [Acidobacteriaceae bacterium]|jgi:4'-phosphopantetheinyl transferase EntD|nr:4'-phosphopantetheinyl transferase superfamily protein [Acidobacteriaceae bacterium]
MIASNSHARVLSLARQNAHSSATLAWATTSEYEVLAKSLQVFLHPVESLYFRSLPANRRKKSYLLGRYAAKQALRALSPGLDPAEVEIASGVFQYPVVRPALAEPTGVSISHSERVACALGYSEMHPLAIDVEDLVPDRSEVMKTQILPRELEVAGVAWPCPFEHRCTMIWTAKEALSKMLRCGMTCPYGILAVKELYADGRIFGGQFENFGQYRFQTWVGSASVMSIVLPRNSTLETDLGSVVESWL